MKGSNDFYNGLKKFLEEKEIVFEEDKDTEELWSISFSAIGDDLAMNYIFNIDPNGKIAVLMSPIPISVDKTKMAQVAVGIALINDDLLFGNFDYNPIKGNITFRLPIFYGDMDFTDELFDYLLFVSFDIVEKYNDKLFMLAKDMINLEDLKDFIENK